MKKSEFWCCKKCNAQNHEIDANCQFCDDHEHYTTSAEWNNLDPDGPQSCTHCSKTYPLL